MDIGLAIALGAWADLMVWSTPDLGIDRGLAMVLVTIPFLPLAVRRRAPAITLIAVVFAEYVLFTHPPLDGLSESWSVTLPAIYASMYAVAAYRPRVISLSCFAGLVLFVLVLGLGSPYGLIAMLEYSWAIFFVPITIAWIAGDYMRLRRDRAARYAAQALLEEQHRADVARQAMADDNARQAAAEERTRIARELHDVIAHSMSVMVVQAGAARRVVLDDPQEAERSLAAIEKTGREALVEMRRLLGVVRKRNGRQLELAPQPGLEHLPALVEKVREAGLSVETRVAGNPRSLPPGLALAVYRIVQEALTNTIKHSEARHATIALSYAADSLTVEIADDGHGRVVFEGDRRPDGFGLIGLRERVGLFGGEFDSGNLHNYSGFRVKARLPLTAD